MTREQWTVLGLLIVLASLEVIRSPNVRGFFSGFFEQFGISSSTTKNYPNANNVVLPNAPIKGMPTSGPGPRRNY